MTPLAPRGVVALFLISVLLLGSSCTTTSTPDDQTANPSVGNTAEDPPGDLTIVEDPDEPQLPVTVVDAEGRSVTIADISRIVVLRGNIAEVLFSLGLGDNVVGRDISTTFSEAEDLPLVTRAHDITAESVLSLHPTLVLADTDARPVEALEQIRNVGVPVVMFAPPLSVSEVGPRIQQIGEALGLSASAEKMAADTESAIAAITSDPFPDGPPSVAFLYIRGQSSVYLLAGPGSGADSVIEAAGAIDAGTAMGLDRPFTPLTSEALVQAAPEVILMTTTGLESVGGIDGLLEIPGIGQTPAGVNRRVVTIEDGLLYSFGPRTPEVLALLAADLHEALG